MTNNEFKNAAFIEEQLSFVKDHSINSEKDKITINSETNIYSFYPNETSRLKSPSRYALAMGVYSSTNDIYGHSMYWTKSASTTSYKAVAVNTNGTLGGRYVWYTNTGVLPSINLDIGAFDNV